MFIKLGILAGVIILTGMIFSNEITNIFPTTSATVVDSLKNDVTSMGAEASKSVEQRIDKSIDKIVNKTNTTITNEISEAGNKISVELMEVKRSSENAIANELLDLDPIDSIQNIFSGLKFS